jgi:hypothetical protein
MMIDDIKQPIEKHRQKSHHLQNGNNTTHKMFGMSLIEWVVIGGLIIVLTSGSAIYFLTSDKKGTPSNSSSTSGQGSNLQVTSGSSGTVPTQSQPLTQVSSTDEATLNKALQDLQLFSQSISPLDFNDNLLQEMQADDQTDIQNVDSINLSTYSTTISSGVTQITNNINSANSNYNNAFSYYENGDRLDELQSIDQGNTDYNSAVNLLKGIETPQQ